ncbi:MAG: hypothetical protein GY822_22995 [Deltaproteobacteria bacterium]|nr:hypothetical protein [Deltaproteobacteria bacterium]
MRTQRNRTRNTTHSSTSTSASEAAEENAVSGTANTQSVDANADRDGRRPFEASQMDDAPAFTSADFRLEFRISVQPMPGGTKTPKPALMDDWKSAVVDAAAKEAAMDEMRPLFESAQAQAEQQLGRPLERRELGGIRKPIIDVHMRPLRAKYFQVMSKDTSSRSQTIDNSLLRHGARMQNARDPFMPLALGDPAARAKDRVLWENPKVMVIVDSFSPTPKALVVPKTPTLFPPTSAPVTSKKLPKSPAKYRMLLAKLRERLPRRFGSTRRSASL